MVLCLFVDCHARSGRDKDVSFFRVPSIDTNHGEEAEERSIERRTQWIAAISRDDLTEQILKNDRVCSRHFVSGKPAKDFDRFNVGWVPTLNLGHSKRKKKDSSTADQDRAERAKARRKKKLNEAKVEIETLLKMRKVVRPKSKALARCVLRLTFYAVNFMMQPHRQRTLIIYLRQIKKSSNLTKSISGIATIKCCFTLVFHHMKF